MDKTHPGTLSVLVTLTSRPSEQHLAVVSLKASTVHLLAKCCDSPLGARYLNVTVQDVAAWGPFYIVLSVRRGTCSVSWS